MYSSRDRDRDRDSHEESVIFNNNLVPNPNPTGSLSPYIGSFASSAMYGQRMT